MASNSTDYKTANGLLDQVALPRALVLFWVLVPNGLSTGFIATGPSIVFLEAC